MKRTILAAAAVALGLLLLVRFALPDRTGRRFDTPLQCLEAYREASLSGDTTAYLHCLTPALRSEMEQRYFDRASLAEAIRHPVQSLKGWTALPADATTAVGSIGHFDVEETTASGKRRVRIRLERSTQGWLIAEIGKPIDVPVDVPYGTHVSGKQE